MLNKNTIINTLKILNNKYKQDGFRIMSLFGSYARGTQDVFSDIDLTYSINHNIFYNDDAFAKIKKINDIKKELESSFCVKIDLIPFNTKNKLIQETIKMEQILV